MPSSSAAILIIGNEILSGGTQDVNVQFIATRLGLRGINLREVRVVRDDETAIVKAARELSSAHTYVFSTGGIGPTHDDITADCMAKAFSAPLEINPAAKKLLEEYYAAKSIALNEGRLRMARIPKDAALISNSVSAAPGFKIGNVYVMAGVPNIMQAMFLAIEAELPQGLPLLSNAVSCSLREGDIAVEMENIQKQFPDIEIGSYPSLAVDGSPHLRLVLRGTEEKRLQAATDKITGMVKNFGGDFVVAYQRPLGGLKEK